VTNSIDRAMRSCGILGMVALTGCLAIAGRVTAADAGTAPAVAPTAGTAVAGAPAASSTLVVQVPSVIDNTPPDPLLVKRGARVYKTNCASCHGATGQGDGSAAASIVPKPRNFTKEPLKFGESEDQMFHTVSEGIFNTQMPAWKTTLDEKARRAAVAFVRSIRISTYNKLSATASGG